MLGYNTRLGLWMRCLFGYVVGWEGLVDVEWDIQIGTTATGVTTDYLAKIDLFLITGYPMWSVCTLIGLSSSLGPFPRRILAVEYHMINRGVRCGSSRLRY